MKRIGIILVAIGLLITVFTGFNFVTREKVVDVGALHISKNKNHGLSWSPFIGFAVMIVGGVAYLIGTQKAR